MIRSPFAAVLGLLLASCAPTSDGASPHPIGDAARGATVAETNGCTACHQPDGRGAGPSWTTLADLDRQLSDGRTVPIDDAYLTRSIADPQADIAVGYDVLEMPTLNLDPQQVRDLVAHLRGFVHPDRADHSSPAAPAP